MVCFDYARGIFQPILWHYLTFLEVGRHSSVILIVLDRVAILLVACFQCARDMFRLCSGYVSTVLVVLAMLDLRFGQPQDKYHPCLRYVSIILELSFDHTRGMFRLCSWYDSTMLVVSFNHYRGMFQPCSWYFLTVLEVCCHSSDVLNVLEIISFPLELFCFDRARDMFDPLVLCFDSAPGMF